MKSHDRPGRLSAVAATIALVAAFAAPAFSAGDEVIVYKDPDCGCCGKWADHMRAAGFRVREVRSLDMAGVKREAGVPPALGSCHTAKVGGYVVEGHVPATDVKRLLAERPGVAGISAPGMPPGSPGMEGPYPSDRYEVVSFGTDGRTQVFANH